MTAGPQPPRPADSAPATPSARLSMGAGLAVATAVTALVALVYADAVGANFFNDDFHWLHQTRRFEWSGPLHLDRYDHFYRPVIEVYFHLGQLLVGCDPRPFHLASIGLHLVNTGLLYLLGRAVTGRAMVAAVAALLFCAQPSYVEAVVWVGAITDLLPATWFLLTLWLHWHYLQRREWRFGAAAFTTFVLCLGTHETAVTIVPMMLALDALVSRPAWREWPAWVRARVRNYAPFTLALAAFLVVAYIVNTRSYLVRDGYYAFGWHAAGNILDYIASLYVGRRRLWWHTGVVLVFALLAVKGSPRTRFYLTWLIVSLLPVSFFTWGGASRYLYVPAAGFSLLIAELLTAAWDRASWRLPKPASYAVAVTVLAVLVIRFAGFAETGVDDFRRRIDPYDRFTLAVRASAARTPGADAIPVSARDLDNIPALYRDAAAETALCRPGVTVFVAP